jgi:hypothetical protein
MTLHSIMVNAQIVAYFASGVVVGYRLELHPVTTLDPPSLDPVAALIAETEAYRADATYDPMTRESDLIMRLSKSLAAAHVAITAAPDLATASDPVQTSLTDPELEAIAWLFVSDSLWFGFSPAARSRILNVMREAADLARRAEQPGSATANFDLYDSDHGGVLYETAVGTPNPT